jgi:hypothetical protein
MNTVRSGQRALADVLVMLLDRRPGHLPQPGVSQLREPFPDPGVPLCLAQRGAARRHPGLDRRGHVLPDRLAVHIQALRDLADPAALISVDQDLGHIDHVEGSPRHRPPAPDVRVGRNAALAVMARSSPTRPSSPWGIT